MRTACDIFGIDLGTTNSCIAVLQDGKPRVIPADGNGIVPSVVSFDNGKLLVGRTAKNRAAAFPEQTVRSIKRSMGLEETYVISGKAYAPEDISAMILRYLCDEAERLEGRPVRRAVITVPAYFSDAQRRATREAGRRAGLTVERIINEPTAAALFYDRIRTDEATGGSGGKERLVLVYDLGGGTFDVTVLRAGEIVEVLASTGDTRLGGDDFDRCIVDRILDVIRERDGVSLDAHVPALARLSAAAEQAKMELSDKASAWIREGHIPTPDGGFCSVEMELTREDFEEMSRSLLERTAEFVGRALSEAGLRADQIDRVLLVGGMTRMPAVSALVENLFGHARMPVVDPDRSVAAGAAIQGGICTGDHCEQILVDVTPHTLSVNSYSKGAGRVLCTPSIPRNTQIPVTRARTFCTMYDDQDSVKIEVLQGESELPEENALLGNTKLSLAKADGGCPVIVEYSYDLDGIVHVTAEQKGYSRKVEIRIDSRRSNTAVEQDIEVLRDEADGGGEDDAARPAINFVTARARALLGKMPAGERRDSLSALLARYEKALAADSDDLDDIEDELLSLMEDRD